jgi:hypothetical protein
MSTTSIRERVSTAMLRTGMELAIDQREIEQRLAAAATRNSSVSSAQGVVATARWAHSFLLWLAWRIHPRTSMPSAAPEFSGQ